MRLVAVAVVAALVTLAGVAAEAKEGGHALLATELPLDARPGDTVEIAWAVRVRDGESEHPFGAGGMFVQLLSRTGAALTTASTETGTGNVNTVRLRVPAGGIGGIRVGLHGTSCDASGCRPAPVFFPVENDPFLAGAGTRCDVSTFRSTFADFTRALARGDGERLDALFADDRFGWSSRIGDASTSRAQLVAHLLARHAAGERLRLVAFRFNGYDRVRELGHFAVSVDRRPVAGAPWRRVAGKGAIDCSGPSARIAVLGLGS